jgi:hypothetical protein
VRHCSALDNLPGGACRNISTVRRVLFIRKALNSTSTPPSAHHRRPAATRVVTAVGPWPIEHPGFRLEGVANVRYTRYYA